MSTASAVLKIRGAQGKAINWLTLQISTDSVFAHFGWNPCPRKCDYS
jgi:hypothetical protein